MKKYARHAVKSAWPLPKIWLIMRLTVAFMIIACLQVSAKGTAQTVTLSQHDVSLEKLFREIRKQTGYQFFYKDELLSGARKVPELNVKNASIDEVLRLSFKDQPLTFEIVEKTIIVKKKEKDDPVFQAPPPPAEVHGKVVNEKGEPVAGAAVQEKNAPGGTATKEDGSFVLKVSGGNAVLVVSYVGYTTREVPVNGKADISITLQSANNSLTDIVVVGYGTQKKVNLTGSVATVGGDKLENRPLVNLADGLVGLVPNLNVNLGSGQPGTAASFNIRGYTSVSGSTSPLILVDGVQRDPNLIDPNNVESVTVLKDAASAAIYGGRAAYGVILITTRSGRRGGKPQISYSGSYTTSRPTVLPDYVNSDGYIKLFNSAQRTGSLSGGYTSSDPLTAQDSILAAAYRANPAQNPDAYPDPGNPKKYRYVGNTDWIKVLYPGWAPQQEHFLSLSSGEGKTTYAASMGYFRQEGLEKVANQVYERYTPSLKINSEINDWLSIGLDMSMTHTNNNGGAATRVNQGGPASGSWIPGDLRPLQPVYNPDGHFSGQGNYTNPVAVLTLSGRDINVINDFWSTGRVTLKPVRHLTINGDFTWNGFSRNDKANLVPFNEYGVDGVFLDIFPWTNPSQVSTVKANNNYTALNAYATYENTFHAKHYLKILAGYNQEYQHYQIDSALARNLVDPNLPAIGVNNDSKPHVGGAETQYALIGSFFRVNYIYDKRYLLEVNGRYDGTSRFQPANRYTFSPSVSAGWNIAEEHFLEGVHHIFSQLKLRASYGELPNQLAPANTISSTAQYPYIATMPTNTVGYLFNNQPGVYVGTPLLISPNFTWEKVQTRNIGLDYALMKDRLSGSFDYFITYTKNMLTTGQQLPAVLGTTAPPSNSADLRTNGWEFSVTWKDKALNNQLFYSITLGLSDAHSTITRYSGNPTNSLSDYYPGMKINNIWGYESAGFYQTDAAAAAVNNSALAGYTWLAGDTRYADLNHDGKIDYGANTLTDHGDKKIIGNSTPRYKFGLNLNASYKGFDFAAFIQGVLKADYAPGGAVFFAFPYDEYGIPYKYAMNYWTPENTNAYYARPRFNGSGNTQVQTKYLQNAAFARVKQLTLGYTLPKKLTDQWKIQRVRAYITGANLLTITSLFKGIDPEIVNYQGSFQTYPINKSVSFGLQVSL